MESRERDHIRYRLMAISLSFAVGAGLMVLKFYVYHLTNSAAILSDALESIINVVASALALGSILLAAKPPDKTHPYGHGKIEYFSAGFEGALIILAALGIFKTGASHLLHPQQLPQLAVGVLILLGVTLVNLALGLMLISVGKRTSSIALVADGKHVLTDVYTSGGVLVGLLLITKTSLYWLDGGIACLVGIHVLISGGKLVRESFKGLMDAAEPALLREIANLLVEARKDIWIDIHELRAWRSGNFVHIDLHLILPRDLPLDVSHREAKELENILVDHFEGKASVLIHTDPCEDPDCPVCKRHLCRFRVEDAKGLPTWDVDSLTMQGRSREVAMPAGG
jgi:cation diffusion facilitator family transporter